MKTIDLSPFRGQNSTTYTGREAGEKTREKIKLSSIEKDEKEIEFVIPEGTTSINPSFFLGLFFDSYEKVKDQQKFLKKYKFVFSDEDELIREILKENIDDALREAELSMDDNSFLKNLIKGKK